MAGLRKSLSAILLIFTFTQIAHADRSQLQDGYLLVPRIDVDGFGALELHFRIEFQQEYLFVLDYVTEASQSIANSGSFDPVLLTLDIDTIELPGGELYWARLGLVADSPEVIFNLLDALPVDQGSTGEGGSAEADSIERGGTRYDALCAGCHGADGSAAGSPPLTGAMPLDELVGIIEQTMPFGSPDDCAADCAADIASYIQATFVNQDEIASPSNPKILHRLNRSEFNNTIRDLLGTEQQPAMNFPADDTGYGFDNIAAVLSLSPLQVELYEQAAWSLAEELVTLEGSPGVWYAFAQDARCSTGGASGDFWNLWSNGTCSIQVSLPVDGTYKLSARIAAHQAGGELAQAALVVDGSSVLTTDVTATSGSFELKEATATLGSGVHEIGVAFLNDYYNPQQGADRNLLVDWFQLEGPLEIDPSDRRLIICDPEVVGEQPCAESILQSFLLRAWRRPPTGEEIDRLYGLVELARSEGDDFNTGITLAAAAALQSPNFIFRVELDVDAEAADVHPLDDYELASRLSYFLWSSTPDVELLDLADQGRLQDPGELQNQVERMLDDPRSTALIENFAGQWLHTRAIADVLPDPAVFPQWRESLKESMKQEADLFFRTFIDEERSMLELLTATDTFIDSNLAGHYGIPGTFGDEPVRVDLGPDTLRRGILGQAGLLAVLSYPTRTSPVLRGKWVLGELLCAEPPPPPPGVEGLAEEAIKDGTVAEVLAQHRQREECAVCHDLMDPIGLGLENFDGIGAWRSVENGTPIDPSGILYGAGPFTGPAAMSDMLAQDPRFPACVTEKLFTYGMGRGTIDDDQPHIEAITRSFVESDHNFRSLVTLIVTSEPFRTRSHAAGEQP